MDGGRRRRRFRRGRRYAVGRPANSFSKDYVMKSYPSSRVRQRKSAFTLVELLVVITIIGILIALLLPAVQAAREAARKLQCTNNLKQIALACLTHEQLQGVLPSGGWGDYWAGDPDRGFVRDQPGGWLYNILPYIEEQAIHDLGMNGNPHSGDKDVSKANGIKICMTTAVKHYYCPSRRQVDVYYAGNCHYYNLTTAGVPQPTITGQTDYAANGGSSTDVHVWDDSQPLNGVGYHTDQLENGSRIAWTDTGKWAIPWYGVPRPDLDWGDCNTVSKSAGVMPFHGNFSIRDITDGAAYTYLCGEKYMRPEAYTPRTRGDITDFGSDQSWDHGNDYDVCRFTSWLKTHFAPPHQDQEGYANAFCFGSAHPGSFSMALCDGSVQAVSYSIDKYIHDYLGRRNDGHVLDKKQMAF